MPGYEIYVRAGLLDTVPAGGKLRHNIAKFIRSLRDDPHLPGDFVERDASQREMQVKLVGGCALSYWVDEPAKIVMVAKVEAAD